MQNGKLFTMFLEYTHLSNQNDKCVAGWGWFFCESTMKQNNFNLSGSLVQRAVLWPLKVRDEYYLSIIKVHNLPLPIMTGSGYNKQAAACEAPGGPGKQTRTRILS